MNKQYEYIFGRREKIKNAMIFKFKGCKHTVNLKIVLSFVFGIILINGNSQCDFKSIGHRGGSSYYFPENTLLSLEQGFLQNTFAAEVDVRYTKDNVLVLMHDSYIDRTTNGNGEVNELSLSYLKTLDAGNWKDPTFNGTKVPTLKEAMKLAARYDKKLYLNMKVFAPELIAKTLEEADVEENLILLDPDDLEKVKIYHEILPNTPLVYFGALPDTINTPEFYAYLKEHGVIAIEIPADYIYEAQDSRYEELRDMAHSYQLELWAYTVNDPAYFKFLKDFGIDGLETDRPAAAFEAFCNNSDGGYFPIKQITGQWDFNHNLFGTIGSQLVAMGDTAVEGQKIEFGTTESFALPSIEDSSINIARIPAFDAEHALLFFSNIAPEGIPGGLVCDNTYSIIFDLLVPSGNDSYTSILQTSNSNSNDGDFFLLGETNSMGVLGQYEGGFEDSTWVRLALVFDLYDEELNYYLNGEYVSTIELLDSKDGRFCLNNNWGIQSSNFFSDENGETNPVFVSSIQVRNYAMDAFEIKELGYPKAKKIENLILQDSTVSCPEFENEITKTTNENFTTLYAFAGDSVNYRWEIDKGFGWKMITGTTIYNSATSSLKITDFKNLSNGDKFRCIAFNECQTFSKEYILEDVNTGNFLLGNNDSNFIIYPNPSSGSITIDSKRNSKFIAVKIYNIYGTKVLQRSFNFEKLKLNLAPGTYLVQLQNDEYMEIKKLLIY